MSSEPIRLQKLLAHGGLGSRREIERLIEQGRIAVNGEVATPGTKATDSDAITVDGNAVHLDTESATFLLNKPLGVLSTVTDDRGRPTVTDLIDTDLRIYPVGRLDINTSGLILLTTDGELTLKLTHPRYGVNKKYVVQVSGEVDSDDVSRLREGIELEDGVTAPAKVRVLAQKHDATLLEITIHEGRNRQIRRMISAIGHDVVSLHRSQIGPIADDSLKPGDYRPLGNDEIHALFSAATQNTPSSHTDLD
jgi:23S rRNA pseudouridine2605 synthase